MPLPGIHLTLLVGPTTPLPAPALLIEAFERVEITHKDTIMVRKSPHPLNMITLPEQHYFDVLKAKLRWSGGRV